ncbi:MAG: hypothetical protein Kow006_12180 [Gammaproteobacteria bacterium]
MELLFLALLVLLMVLALSSGYPVAFALPGSAILTIVIAALCGYLFADNPDAYFAQGGPVQWLTAGVTNFRSLYWEVERDTLIAIPLFIFMGIMLQRSKIAEDLLVTMAQLFGPVPGGLGISVVFVGALLAATTGIVGATVIAMGLISLPAMLRNNYSKSLATGTICASGTLGQIIPPSIVLIILADQLSSAVDQASTLRKADYKEATGEFSMPSELDITSASAGDMFMGAFLPGLVLVGFYMAYILISALIRPKTAPPVHYEGQFDRQFWIKVMLALIPPLSLIFVVLGSIILGIATVNQAGAVGAVGALIMGGYRLTAGKKNAYYPAILAVASLFLIFITLAFFDINVKNIRGTQDIIAIVIASIGSIGLLIAIGWSIWRAYTIENTLREVMMATAHTTSMVFIILIGAAMLTSAFRAFGGEELVREYLTSLPGGFWTQFIVVMLVMFLLGFFLDFLEIAVVVVPIVAPILLADPSANVTAVWFGVMVGLNIQTSFLTPPFGFALFYLRGVAPPEVKTTHIYKGAVAFIALQLCGLAVAGVYPSLVNYLPQRVYLTSETAPPPVNPRIQACLENYLFSYYDESGDELRSAISKMRAVDVSYLPDRPRKQLQESLDKAEATFDLVAKVHAAEAVTEEYAIDYRPLHRDARQLQREIRRMEKELEELERNFNWFSSSGDEQRARRLKEKIERTRAERAALEVRIPEEWEEAHSRYKTIANEEKKARFAYRRNVDEAYGGIVELRKLIGGASALAALGEQIAGLRAAIEELPPKEAMALIEKVESALAATEGGSATKSLLYKARRSLRGSSPKPEKALEWLEKGIAQYEKDVTWLQQAEKRLLPALNEYEEAIRYSIGLRQQKRMTTEQAKNVAACQSVHRDVSLAF